MSFNNPTSEVYFLNVPFSPDYKNIIDFSSKSEQEREFKKLADKHFTGVNIIRKNKTLEIKGDFAEYYKYNYMMFKNPELDNKWWYAFIIDSNYTSTGSTNIVFQIDVWQTFQFDITYYRCMIERGIVPRTPEKAQSTGITIDGYKNWTQSEPLNVDPLYSNNISLFASLDWEPFYAIEAVSRFNKDKNDFEYGGAGVGDNYSSLYMFPIGITVYPDRYTKTVKQYGDINDHRPDLVNVRVIPAWLGRTAVQNATGDANTSYGNRYLTANPLSEQEDTVNISTTTLSNGYKPRNKKMLGSLSRAFCLYNFNGLNIIIKPELLHSDDVIKISINARPIGLQSIRLIINSIDNINEHYFDIPYNLTFDVAYNSNTGVQKTLGIISSATQIAKGVANVAVGVGSIVAGGAIGGLAGSSFANTIAGGVSSSQFAMASDRFAYQSAKGAQTSLSGGSGILGGASDIFTGGVSLAQALASKTSGTSTVPDLLHYSAYNMTLRLSEYCPSKTDCKVIDQFLDMYGYSINESGMLNAWMKTRSNWNYVKTTNCNLKVKGSATYEQILKDMFNNGVTIWHGFDVFGTYNSNRDDGQTINK